MTKWEQQRACMRLRRRGVRLLAAKYGGKVKFPWLKYMICGMLLFGVLGGGARCWKNSGMTIQMYHMEKQVQIDLVVPESEPNESEERFGIRINPDAWEIQFYHRTESGIFQ